MGVQELAPPISARILVTCLAWYLVSSITSQLSKLILIKFPYPLFLSQCQFLISAAFAFLFISLTRTFPQISSHFPNGSVPVDSSQPVFQLATLVKILPLGLFQFCGKFFSLSATSLIPLATVSSIKALSPLLIVTGYRVVYKVHFLAVTYLSLTPLVGGVILIIAADSVQGAMSVISGSSGLDYDTIKGLVFCFLSTFIFASQNIYGKQLMTWDAPATQDPASLVLNTKPEDASTHPYRNNKLIKKRTNSIKLPYSTSDLHLDEKTVSPQVSHYSEQVNQNNKIYNPFAFLINKLDLDKVAKPDKLTIILYCSVIGFVFSVGGFLTNELPRILYEETHLTPAELVEVMVLIILDSLSHFAQTILAFHLLGLMPALSYSIASMMKRIVLIAVSIILAIGTVPVKEDAHKWFGKITNQQLLGLVLISVGLYCYDKWGSSALARH
ncbi:TPT-domain-containing protein [Suhomyces tanzawaensis NRRL Y-17324]|uniref:TPT-domain-containing protein n=1 Tax=Suhomyces tanzawaensis NRRL Y-17324 TaxID=984487 RepID=A0A1E4SNR2_9ASCO|nr:TPT-domain-containing protein [Suhomyces tanzawaensis NRRL Y-17324]ODV81032.1 TPT-domain-containing protein [Suhomyces tanzawaensis NRRL Y-17324]